MLNNFFPNFSTKSSFGLDFRDGSIRFIELIQKKDKLTIGKYGKFPIPEKIIANGVLKDRVALEKLLISIKKNFGINSAHLSVSKEYTDSIQEYLSVCKNAGIKIKSFEHETEAISRSVLRHGDTGTYMIVDLGEASSRIFVFSNQAVASIYNLSFTGDMISHKDEIAKHFLDWHLAKNEDKKREPVKKIIISGIGVDLESFAEYLSMNMKHGVEVANVWVNILDTGESVPAISFNESFNFTQALGLALKDFVIDPIA